jgi:Tfp pilus assembly protein PilN
MYSFTHPKPKPLVKEDTKLWLVFIGVSLVLYISFAVFLQIKTMLYKKDIKNYEKEIATLNQKIKQIKEEKKFVFKQKTLYEDIMVKNSLMKDSIKNLLDLIPDPITLSSIFFDKNKLIIYGVTPTKDIYNMLMLPPLESIFTETKTYFYQMPNGWYKFKSENYLKEKQ